jgi:hypothetical protein
VSCRCGSIAHISSDPYVTKQSIQGHPLQKNPSSDNAPYNTTFAVFIRYTALASTAKPTAQTVGGIGLDSTYGLIAVIHQKLGEPDKADAAIKKAVDLRIRLLGRADAQDFTAIAKFATLIAIVHDDLPTAANYIKTAQLFTDTYGRLLMVQVGRTQNAEAALEIANTISGRRDLWHAYSDMIPEMAKAGKQGEIDKLINAWSGNPRQKSNFYWPIINGMIDNGDLAGARKFADKYHLADDDNGKLRLDSQLLSSEKIAKNRSQAGPIIREMFTIGEAKDVAANTKDSAVMYDRGKSYSAQHAAELAFQNGYTDLGIELYQKATNKDHRPLLYAFSDEISKSDMTTVLMLAQYNATSPAYLSYVIDSAIRHLKKTQG